MKNSLLLLAYFTIVLFAKAQENINRLNDFKFVYMAPLLYENGEEDRYGIALITYNRLLKSGLQVMKNKAPIISNPDLDNCAILTCVVSHVDVNNHYLFKKDHVAIQFFDCLNQLVYESSAKTKGLELNSEKTYQQAIQEAIKPFSKFRFNYRTSPQYSRNTIEKEKKMVRPSYPGGIHLMDDFMKSFVEIPKMAFKENIGGSVDFSFMVDKRGLIHDVEITKGVSAEIDKEVARVASLMPRWIAGIDNGKPKDMKMTYSYSVVPVGKLNKERADY